MATKKKKKGKPGRKPIPESKKKFRIVTYCSYDDIAQDNGVSRYLIAMNKEVDKKIFNESKI